MSQITDNLIEIKRTLPQEVTLVAVSKFHPLECILEAYSAGQRVFGESRPQELYSKVKSLAQMSLPEPVVWHFIGHLQTNKLKLVLPYVAMVESVDSLSLLDSIEKWAAANPLEDSSQRHIKILIEVHIASEESKQGFTPEEAYSLLSSENRWPHIEFCGLMGMASFTDDEAVIRSDFSRLTSLFDSLKTIKGQGCISDSFRELSFGMSEDYLIALGMGASIVRIGTSIFGSRI